VVNNVRNHGSIPMLSWTPEGGSYPADHWQLQDIIGGAHDAYIRAFAQGARAWGHPFFLRIMHEMNGSWGYPWQEDENGNQRGQFVQAWRRIVDLLRQEGAHNASLVWCPNIDYPGSPNPTFASLYPGDSYVDWTCLDGYNWAAPWQSFDQVFRWSYEELLRVAPSKPVMVGEFGCNSGSGKAAWLTDALKHQLPTRFPRVRAAVYFNWNFDGAEWRIEVDPAAATAWRRGIGANYFLHNQFGSLTGRVPVP
jgi:beta-mannanase